MIKCTNCGTENPDRQILCQSCSQVLVPPQSPPGPSAYDRPAQGETAGSPPPAGASAYPGPAYPAQPQPYSQGFGASQPSYPPQNPQPTQPAQSPQPSRPAYPPPQPGPYPQAQHRPAPPPASGQPQPSYAPQNAQPPSQSSSPAPPVGYRVPASGAPLPQGSTLRNLQNTPPAPMGQPTQGVYVQPAQAPQASQPGRVVVNQAVILKARKFSPALAGVVLLCFLLPFVTISCDALGGGRQDITTMTGLEVMTGKTINLASDYGLGSQSSSTAASQSGHVDPEPLAIVAFLAAAAAIVVVATLGRIGLLAGAASSAVAFVCLLLARFSIDSRINQPATFTLSGGSSQPLPTGYKIAAVYQIGYWLALLFSAAAAGAFLYYFLIDPKDDDLTINQTRSIGPPPP